MNVTVISPHPDDETLGCGGTLLKHKSFEDTLCWIVVTRSHSPQWSTETIEEKGREIDAVAKAYGFAQVVRLDFPTMQLDTLPLGEVISSIANAIRLTKPDELYVCHFGDIHTDHRVVYDATMSAIKPFNSSRHGVKRVLCYETISSTEAAPPDPSRAFLPNVFSDITDFMEKKLEIMALYKTECQPFPLPRASESIRALARFRGATIGVEYAESFALVRELK